MHGLLCRRYGLLGLPFDHDLGTKGKSARGKRLSGRLPRSNRVRKQALFDSVLINPKIQAT